MDANKKTTDDSWDPDTAPEIPDWAWAEAQISISGKVVRKATGTLTKRGRPPLGDEPRQQITLRLPRDVIRYFKAGGPGWQSRISEALERAVRAGSRKPG
jgi:uncharacterized protein (DUF4415 family)